MCFDRPGSILFIPQYVSGKTTRQFAALIRVRVLSRQKYAGRRVPGKLAARFAINRPSPRVVVARGGDRNRRGRVFFSAGLDAQTYFYLFFFGFVRLGRTGRRPE